MKTSNKKLKKGKKRSWIDFWQSDEYILSRQSNFNLINDYLKNKPKYILDIGCGLAIESNLFQKKYYSDLFLIDGDSSTTINNPRFNKYGPVEDFQFYNKISDLTNIYNEQKMLYKFYDYNNLDENYDFGVKFDLIYSNLSCGFHYPAIAYKKIIEKNSNLNTIIIMDFQKNSLKEQLDDIKIIAVVSESDTAIKLHFRYT